MIIISLCFMMFVVLMFFSVFSFFFSLVFLLKNLVIFIEWNLVTLNSNSIVMTMLLDWMSLMFLSFVLFISSLVILYSGDYMSDDKFITRFIFLVIMFVFSMVMLIISPNLISILLGWDGLGLVSYCLVIYFQNIKSYNAGMLTVLSNRLGDVFLLFSIAWMLNYGSWNFIFYLDLMKNSGDMQFIGGLVLMASMTKSAQIPFSAWLPAAMAAPTPVSALVHSSTLVTAGVYLLIRFNSLLMDSFLGESLLLISGLTMFMSGLGANYEFDLKKIIALSTLSQLGLMMMTLSIGLYKLAFFHMLIHALFKALLFLCAGAIIHNMKMCQDIRAMGGLILGMPLTCACFNVSNLALCGMPFLSGFYSKDLILEMFCFSYLNVFSFFLLFFSTGLTVCYSFRLIYYTVSGSFNGYSLYFLQDNSWGMLKGMLGLVFMSILGGSLINWFMYFNVSVICLPVSLKLLTLLVCLFGGLVGYLISMVSLNKFNFNKFYFSYFFMGSMWGLPLLSVSVFLPFSLKLGFKTMKIFDQGWSEYFGGQMIYLSLKKYTSYFEYFQMNFIKLYLLMFIFWFIFLVLNI